MPSPTEVRWFDHVSPTAVGLVSVAWVRREVARARPPSEAVAARWVDALIEYQPPRTHGLRNNFIVWVGLLGGALIARGLGAAGWIGYGAMLLAFLGIARLLMVRALRWRLEQLVREDGASPPRG